MSQRALIFDLGNVLWRLDTPGWLDAMNRYKANLDSRQLREFIETTLAAADGGAYGDKELVEAYRAFLGYKPLDFNAAYTLHCRLLEKGPTKVMDILPALKDRYDLYLLSNINPWHRRYIEHTYPAILDLFTARIYSCDVKVRKPQSGIFRQLAASMKTAIADSVYFDDMKVNIDAGKAFGLESVLVTDEDSFYSYLKNRFL